MKRKGKLSQSPGRSLAALRADIDRLDDAILALIEQRLAACAAIGLRKEAEAADYLKLRPGREAAVIDRIAALARNASPELVRQIWRILMAHGVQAQERTEIVIHAPSRAIEVVEQVRDAFGPAAVVRWAASADEAIAAARATEAVAVLEACNSLIIDRDGDVRIFSTLTNRAGFPIAVAIGRIAPEDLADGREDLPIRTPEREDDG